MLTLAVANDNNSSAGELDPAYAQFRDQTRFWIQRVAVPLLMVIGLFGNSITVIIMTRRRMRSTTNLYLAALAFVDMLYLVLTFLLGLSHYPNMATRDYYHYWRLRPFLMMLTDACSNTSVWLTVTFTIERYIAVKYPMKGKVWCTEARAKMLIVFVFVFGILFAAPVPFEWQVVEKELPPMVNGGFESQSGESIEANLGGGTATNYSGFHYSANNNQLNGSSSNNNKPDREANSSSTFTLALDYSDFGRNETYKTIYYRSTAIIFYFIPLFSLMLFNGFLIKSVHQSQKERTKMTRRMTSRAPVTSHCPPLDRSKSTVNGLGEPGPRNGANSDSASRTKGQIKPLMMLAQDNANCAKVSKFLIHEAAVVAAAATAINTSTDDDDNKSTGDLESSNNTKPPASPLPADQANPSLDDFSSQNADYLASLEKPHLAAGPSLGGTTTAGIQVLAPASYHERRITIMLIAVVILFLVCQIPSAGMLIYSSFYQAVPNTNEHALELAFGNIFNCLMAVNAAGNFILYSFLSKKYRKTFVILFCSCPGSNYKSHQDRLAIHHINQSLKYRTSLHKANRHTLV